MIGTFGDVVFKTSSNEIRTFEDFVRSATARWAKHDIHLQKPKSEYLGPDIDTISFTMRFDIRYGMNPRKEMDLLLDMSRTGKAETLIIGGKGLGINKWYIESITQNWGAVDNKGLLLTSSADLTLKEYV